MSRSSDYYYYGNRQQGWDTTSHDYQSHVARMERTPTALPDVPQYPNVHMIFNKKKVIYEEENDKSHHNHHHHEPEAPKKVQFVEYKETTTEIDKDGDYEVYQKTIDMEADGFIQQKHKNFELIKWATFKKV